MSTSQKTIRIALAGNPNSGKTTLFNALTGGNAYVGNWPGVTVEQKNGTLKKRPDVVIQDLPGIYSLSPFSKEEVVARTYLVDEKPDVILNIVDGSNIERNLYLTTQLLELGLPIVVAVNMMDVVAKRGDKLDLQQLSKSLRCPVVGISALTGEGIGEATQKAIEVSAMKVGGELPHVFSGSVEHAIAHIEETLQGRVPSKTLRWYAIKMFERDEAAQKILALDESTIAHIEQHIVDCEKELDDDAESIITDQRYRYLGSMLVNSYKKNATLGRISISDKIDRILTNRILALPIFAGIIWCMYYVAVSTVGSDLTKWMNDELFGDEWGIPKIVGDFLEKIGAGTMVSSLILDGIVQGVGTVLGFVPQILIVFFFLSFLEDCGYMARVAFIMDRLFRNFGLSGKSFIPILVGTGCGVPGIMAARTIEQQRDRRLTIMLSTFIPCSAKVEIIGIIASSFFPGSVWVAPSMFFLGIAIIILGGIALKKSRSFIGDPSPFVMELPAYHMPTAKNLALHVWERARGFCIKAGTVIFAACVVLWCLMRFTWNFTFLESPELLDQSILADIGKLFSWIFTPLGFGDWKGAVACVSAEIAKEQATATLGMLAGGDDILPLFEGMNALYPKAAAFSFLVFNLFDPPCLVAIITAFREHGSRKWGWFTVGFQLAVGYTLALMCYQFAVWLAYGKPFSGGSIAAIAIAVVIAALVLRPAPKYKS